MRAGVLLLLHRMSTYMHCIKPVDIDLTCIHLMVIFILSIKSNNTEKVVDEY